MLIIKKQKPAPVEVPPTTYSIEGLSRLQIEVIKKVIGKTVFKKGPMKPLYDLHGGLESVLGKDLLVHCVRIDSDEFGTIEVELKTGQ